MTTTTAGLAAPDSLNARLNYGTGGPHTYQCQKCAAALRNANETQARVLGWRLYTGESVIGKALNVSLCPTCAGTIPPDPNAPKPSWRVRCNTCNWEWEEEYNDGPLSPKAAKEMADYHECKPDVEIAPAEGDRWYRPGDINDDGTVKGPRPIQRRLA